MKIEINLPDDSGLAIAAIEQARRECLNSGNSRGTSTLGRKALRAYLSKYGKYSVDYLDSVYVRGFPPERKRKKKEA